MLFRSVLYQFKEDGHYLLITQWYNKCLGQDTFFMTRISIELCTTSGVTTFIKPDAKLIGVYDMLGRPVANIRRNEVMIYVYSDGTTRKVFID